MPRTMHISESEAVQLGLLGKALTKSAPAGSLGRALSSALKAKRGPSKRNLGQEAFAFHCRTHRLPAPHAQWELAKSVQVPRKDRKQGPLTWKFDFCWPQFQLIVEIDGGVWKPGGGAHSHPVDLERNRLKRNDAALAGFSVIAFPPEDFTGRKREAMEFVVRTLASRGWQP